MVQHRLVAKIRVRIAYACVALLVLGSCKNRYEETLSPAPGNHTPAQVGLSMSEIRAT